MRIALGMTDRDDLYWRHPMLVLPGPNDPNAQDAPAQLQGKIDEPATVVMIVYGGDDDALEARRICEDAATIPEKTHIRRVVACPDPSVLKPQQRTDFFVDGKRAVAVGLNGKQAEALSNAKAKSDHYVEIAFTKAETQV